MLKQPNKVFERIVYINRCLFIICFAININSIINYISSLPISVNIINSILLTSGFYITIRVTKLLELCNREYNNILPYLTDTDKKEISYITMYMTKSYTVTNFIILVISIINKSKIKDYLERNCHCF